MTVHSVLTAPRGAHSCRFGRPQPLLNARWDAPPRPSVAWPASSSQGDLKTQLQVHPVTGSCVIMIRDNSCQPGHSPRPGPSGHGLGP
eukprot:2661895-Rhodomonas_salina.3